jgi:hypothetical protein
MTVTLMGETRNACNIFIGRMKIRRPVHSQEYNIKMTVGRGLQFIDDLYGSE